MKKIGVAILVIIVLFNFIFCNYITYADDDETITYSKEAYDQLTEEGTVDLNDETEDLSVSDSTVGSASGTLASLVTPWFMIISVLLSNVATLGGVTGAEGYTELESAAVNTGVFTICSLVFGEYLLFNVNVYQTNSSLNPDVESTVVSEIIDEIKELVVGWYYVIELVAMVLLLLLIIFTGIRYATAQTGIEKANFKELINTYFIGLAFIFLFPYIVVLLNTLVEVLMDILWTIRFGLENNGYSSFEYEIMNLLITGISETGGMEYLAYAIEYIAFVIVELIFFWKYIVRLFKILLLTFLAPIMAIIHIFSKIRGREGVLKEWAMQYISCLLMQPIHAFIYLVFIFTASEIAVNAPLLGIVFLWVLLRAEKIIEVIFGLNYGTIKSLFSKTN